MNRIKIPWYAQTWIIALMFALWPIYFIPPIIGIGLFIIQFKAIKKIKEDSNKFRNLIDSGYDEAIDLSELLNKQKDELISIEKTIKLSEEKNTELEEVFIRIKNELDPSIELNELIHLQKEKLALIEDNISNANQQESELLQQIEDLQSQYIELEEEILLQDYGFYDPKYDLEDSEAYKIKLKEIRNRQKDLVKSKSAVYFNSNWRVNDSLSEGRKMNNNLIKQAIRLFNNECDLAISKVSINNIASMEKRINNAHASINKMNEVNDISIKIDYLQLKFEEMYLALEYARKIEEEKEEQNRIKEQMREEEKVRKEINAMKAKVEKEETHFINAINKLEASKSSADENTLKDLEVKIKELQAKLAEVKDQKEDVLNRERNTRAGYVYIISNVGSFGEDVYKIGVTRRLTPLDRIRELSSASVPFVFDVHAMIFSDDAPKLENTLHKTFADRRVNLINERKEFFNISLDEIKKIVEESHDKTVEFKTTALAREYKESQAIRKSKLESRNSA